MEEAADRWNGARTLFRRVAKALGAILLIPLGYALAAVAGGAIPANRAWQEAGHGIPIFVRTNGVHTWVMVPAVSREMDWRPILKAGHLRDPAAAGDYLAIGWGNREFYLNTPTWNDLTLSRAVGALFFNGPSLMHVDHEPAPRVDGWHKRILLRPDEYRRLVAFIRRGFATDRHGNVLPLKDRGYDRSDVFYEANGGYNLFVTCNSWTGDALRVAGVRIGVWTPLEQGVMARFD